MKENHTKNPLARKKKKLTHTSLLKRSKEPPPQSQARSWEGMSHLIFFSIPLGDENIFFDQKMQCCRK